MVKLNKSKLTKEEKERLVELAQEAYRNYAPMAEMAQQSIEKLQKDIAAPLSQINESLKHLSPSPAMLASVRQIAKDQQKFAERVIEATAIDISEIIPKTLPGTLGSLSYSSTSPSKIPTSTPYERAHTEEEQAAQKEEFSLTPYQYHYFPEVNSFILVKTIPYPINFSVRSGKDNINILFECFFEIFEERGEEEGNYKVVLAKATELIGKAREKGVKEANRDWLKKTKYNLIQKIPEYMEQDVIISNYDRSLEGYHFKIKTNGKLVN